MGTLQHKPNAIKGWRLNERLELDMPKNPQGDIGDWLLRDHRGRLYILSHEDVKELYDPADEEAREMLGAEEWPPRG